MYKQSLTVDAWIREAEEASRLIEDLENRVKNKNSGQQESIRYSINAKPKLFELGLKLDHLESLLHNPPSKPILTDQDMDFRWKMLLDIQSRTRVAAHDLYAFPSTKRQISLPTGDINDAAFSVKIYDRDTLFQ